MSQLRSYTCPIIVGRDVELARCAELLSAADEGDGRLLCISGEAGIGKSRIARALTEMAAWRGFGTLSGACQEHDRDFPYAPFLDALRHLLHSGETNDMVATL
ncbi:MAG: AAA family ATPase, partial [Thermomicrobiales bacterium]